KNFAGKISAEEREALNAIEDAFSVMDADLDSMLLTVSGVIDLTDLNSNCVSALVQRTLSLCCKLQHAPNNALSKNMRKVVSFLEETAISK
ncbi:6379_t:CDS:2, partial [Paraglomus brasilianum]